MRAHVQVARATLVSLLEAELLQLTCEAQVPQAGVTPEQNTTDVHMLYLCDYRQAITHVLEVQLVKAKSLETKPHKKKKNSGPSKRKHKAISKADDTDQ